MAIKKEMTAQQAYQKLADLCARGEHCQHEMTEKMRQWGISEEEQAQVMERLTKERYVDDERFTRAFVNDKIRYNKWGRRKVEQALWQKRIDDGIAQSVLDAVDNEEYVAILEPMLKQKSKSIRAESDYERRMKLTKWAVGRGFTIDIIRQRIDISDEDALLD